MGRCDPIKWRSRPAGGEVRRGRTFEDVPREVIQVSPRDSLVTFRNVTSERPFGGLSTVSFVVDAGTVYTVLGGPGSGKTATVDLAMGFRRPQTGTVHVLGQDPVTNVATIRRQVALVDGRGRLPGPMSPTENLAFLTRLSGRLEDRIQVVNALRTMGLPDRFLTAPIENLPTSAHVSVLLALAWLRRTPLLVLDDPTAGFDSVATATFIDSLERFRRENVTMLLTTSDALLAGRASDEVAILKAGEKVAERHRHQLLQESLTALYADYVGRSDAPRAR
jgi:ABC-2 type transport system ATP-binding protein